MITFSDLGLRPMIVEALDEIGFEKPTPIQAKTIPHIINSDNDLVALAQTGTGKTAAFSLPIIHKIDDGSDNVQALILCPTRELAIQIADDIKRFIKYLPDISVVAVYGGEPIDKQIRALKKKPAIVVGTPGRVGDMIRRRLLKLEQVQFLVLDEADEMLHMGFKDELDAILSNTPETKQSLLFSATMSKPVRAIASNYMNRPDEITVGDKNTGSDNVQHFYYVVHEKDRYQALRRIADSNPSIHGIIFCRTRRETQFVADKLIQDHYSAEAIHGDVSQEQRSQVMNRFRNKKVQLLVATDVAARGIDVDALTHVINYNLPESSEAYVHRSGRTGRAHNAGISLVIINMREKHKISHLERKIGKSFEHGKIPTGSDICEKQLFNLVEKMRAIEVNEKEIGKYIGAIEKKFEHLDRQQLIKKFISVEFNRFLDHYQDAIDLNTPIKQGMRDGKASSSTIKFSRFSINVGKNIAFGVKGLFALLNRVAELRGVEIGNIDVQNTHTIFEIDERYTQMVTKKITGQTVQGIEINADCIETGVSSSRNAEKTSRERPSREKRDFGFKKRTRRRRY